MAENTTITRRSLLKAAGAVGLTAGTVAAGAAIAGDSEIMQHFAEWRTLKAEGKAYCLAHRNDRDLDKQMWVRFHRRQDEVEAALASARPKEVRELAAIVLAISEFGDVDYAFQNTLAGAGLLPILADMAGLSPEDLAAETNRDWAWHLS